MAVTQQTLVVFSSSLPARLAQVRTGQVPLGLPPDAHRASTHDMVIHFDR